MPRVFLRRSAQELSAVLCDAARDNLRRNGAHNAVVIHSQSEKVARRMLRRKMTIKKETFKTPATASAAADVLIGGDDGDGEFKCSYNGDGNGCELGGSADAHTSSTVSSGGGGGVDFDINAYDVVLVDPPRAGLDQDTLELVSRFEVVGSG